MRENSGDDWRELMTVSAEDALTTDPVAFSADGRSLLMISSAGAETARLVRIDLASGAEQVLAGDPVADVSSVRLDPGTKEPQIVTVAKDRSEYLVLDPSLADDVAAARPLGHRLARLSAALFAEPNPTVIKAVLHRMGEISSPAVRLPLLAARQESADAALAEALTLAVGHAASENAGATR